MIEEANSVLKVFPTSTIPTNTLKQMNLLHKELSKEKL